jgi:uncharacterized membrane protein YbaN (DUF454 family)
VSASAPTRWLLIGIGWICVGLGIFGLVMPMVPGAVFLIIAAACFSRASPRFEAWLVNHRWLGPPIRSWRDSGAIPRNIKVVALISLLLSFLMLIVFAAPVLVIAGIGVFFVALSVYIVTRPAP